MWTIWGQPVVKHLFTREDNVCFSSDVPLPPPQSMEIDIQICLAKIFTKSVYDWGYGNFPFAIIKRNASINLGEMLLIVQIGTYLLTCINIYWKCNESLGSGSLTEITKERVCVYSFPLFAGSYNYYLLFLLSRLETIRAWQSYNCNINIIYFKAILGYLSNI